MTDKEYLELSKKYPWYKEYEGCEEDKEKIVEYNKALVERFPWLLPRNRWNGEVAEDYDWSFTELDSMPDGWRIAFGLQMCEEIQKALEEAQRQDPNGGYKENCITTNYDSDRVLSYIEGYRICEIKSKYAELRWYDNGAPNGVYDVINKYCKMSRYVCEFCGKKAEWISNGWIDPFCETCAKKMATERGGDVEKMFTPIEEFYEE